MKPNEEILSSAQEFYRDAKSHSGQWRLDAREDYDFVAGHQWSESDIQTLKDQLRPHITFNRVGPVIDAVAGSEISNRQEVRFIPRTEGDEQVNEILTGAATWVRDQCDAEDEESDGFIDTVVCGMGWTETRLDYDYDPDGRVVIERVDPLEMYWDNAARKRNLSDAKKLLRVKEVARSEFEAMWPDAIDEIGDGTWMDDNDDSDINVVDPRTFYENNKSRTGSTKKLKVAEYQWCERVAFYRVLDPSTQQIVEMDGEKFAALTKATKGAVEQLKSVKLNKYVYYRAFICGGMVLESGPSPCPYGFTYKCMTGKRDRNKNTWYGLVRPMKDPQRWANKFFSQILHIINSNAKGGALAEKSAFVNPRKAEEMWADPGALILMNDGAIAQGKVRERAAITYPAGLDRLMEFAVSSIRDVTGVNLEMLGLADRQQAGVLEYQRKQAGLTILATLFDSLRRYRKEQGRLLLHFMQEYLSDGRLVRITGQDSQSQYVRLSKDPETVTYDVIVDEAPTSPNQKERTWGILSSMMPMLSKLPIPPAVWMEVLKASPLPSSFTEKVVKIIDEAGQAPPAPDPRVQQAQAMLQIKAQESEQKMTMQNQQMQANLQMQQQQMMSDAQLEKFKAVLDAKLGMFKAEMTAQLQLREQDIKAASVVYQPSAPSLY